MSRVRVPSIAHLLCIFKKMVSKNIAEDWKLLSLAPDQTHHLKEQKPAYQSRFITVLPFHAPGLAPAYDDSGAFHIDMEGSPVYLERYVKTFGFYDLRAAVYSHSGWFHIFPSGKELYKARYAWCGNFQENYCSVCDFQGDYFHLSHDGKRAYQTSYRYAGDFKSGFAVVQNEKGLHTHIDPSGKELHSRWFLDLDVFHKGFARAKDFKGWFHIDSEGNALYQDRFASLEPFYNGFARVETFSGQLLVIDEQGQAIRSLREATDDPFHQASGELVSYWRLNTLDCACKFRLFDFLPSSEENLTVNLPHSSKRRLLRALQEMNLVKQVNEVWETTDKGAFFKTKDLYSLYEALQLWKEEHLTSWGHLAESLQTESCAFEKQYGANWFQWLNKDLEKNRMYHRVISLYAKRDYQKLPLLLPLHNHRSIVDIGGSSGTLLCHLLQQHPHLKGLLLDLPEVLKESIIPVDLQKKIELIPTDFFEDWPPFLVDGAIMARVLHDWPDQEAIQILKKLHFRLEDGGESRIYILENVLQEDTGSGGLLDLNMLIMTGGKERTLDEFKFLLSEAGFILEKTLPLNQVSTILVGKKR